MSKNVEVPKRSQMTVWRMRAECRISKAARTHMHAPGHQHTRKYVILIAFPRQQWFRERASMLRYTYIACLVSFYELFNNFMRITPVHLQLQLSALPDPLTKHASTKMESEYSCTLRALHTWAMQTFHLFSLYWLTHRLHHAWTNHDVENVTSRETAICIRERTAFGWDLQDRNFALRR
jgi:hypothetical protein